MSVHFDFLIQAAVTCSLTGILFTVAPCPPLKCMNRNAPHCYEAVGILFAFPASKLVFFLVSSSIMWCRQNLSCHRACPPGHRFNFLFLLSGEFYCPLLGTVFLLSRPAFFFLQGLGRVLSKMSPPLPGSSESASLYFSFCGFHFFLWRSTVYATFYVSSPYCKHRRRLHFPDFFFISPTLLYSSSYTGGEDGRISPYACFLRQSIS